MWLIVALCVLVVAIAAVLHTSLAAGPGLGSISERWLAEYRADELRSSS